MSDDKEGGMGKYLRKLDEKLNRSKIVEPSDSSDFTVSFRDLSHPTKYDLPDRYGRDEKRFCQVEFIISRGNQDFAFPIYIKTQSVEPTEYIKEAAHRLHLDLLRLAEQTKRFKLRDEDVLDVEEENPFI